MEQLKEVKQQNKDSGRNSFRQVWSKNVFAKRLWTKILLVLQLLVLMYLAFELLAPIDNSEYTYEELNNNYGYSIYEDGDGYVNVIEGLSINSGSHEAAIEIVRFEEEEERQSTLLSGQIRWARQSNPQEAIAGQTNYKYCGGKIYADIHVPVMEKWEDLVLIMTSNEPMIISGLQIRERYIYRVFRILATLVLFGLVDMLIGMFLSENIDRATKLRRLVLLIAVIIVSIPALGSTCYGGDDWVFHYNRIEGIAQELQLGHFPVRIYTQVNNGYGYAAPLFYGELFLYIPAIMYICGLPLFVCGNIFLVLINAVTVGVAYYAFRELVGHYDSSVSTNNISGEATNEDRNDTHVCHDTKIIAIVGAVLYTFAPYRMYCMYSRYALGEVQAMAWLPLVALGVCRIYWDARKNSVGFDFKEIIRTSWPLIVGLSGIIQSHIITTELVVIMLLLVAVILIKYTLTKGVMITYATAAIATVLLNLWFIGPFIDSMSMDIVMKQGSENIQAEGLSLMQVLSLWCTTKNGKGLGIGLLIGVVIAGGMLLKSFVGGTEKNKKNDALGIGGVCITLLIVCVFFSLSIFPWNSIERISVKLAYVLTAIQFPWRYMTMVILFATVLTVLGLGLLRGKHKISEEGTLIVYKFFNVTCLVVANVAIVIGIIYVADVIKNNGSAKYYMVNEPTTFVRIDDYLLDGTSWEYMVGEKNIVSEYQEDCDSNMVIVRNAEQKNVFEMANNTDSSYAVKLPIENYEYMQIRDNEGNRMNILESTDYLTVEIPAGYKGTLVVSYVEPVWWRVCEMVTIIGWAMIISTLQKQVTYERIK